MPRSAKTGPMPDSNFPKETLPQLIRRALAEPRAEALVERVNGTWTPTSSQRVLERVVEYRLRDSRRRLQHGDRVALIAHDSVDWIICRLRDVFCGLRRRADLSDAGARSHAIYPPTLGSEVALRRSHATLERLRTRQRALPRSGGLRISRRRFAHGVRSEAARRFALRIPSCPATYEANAAIRTISPS